ncbi:eukaryotic translation initiation factor 3 subunit M [Schistocerca americana]|uniref:eukaryotic translation initiation factor 3 subunit M n=1 Tax=Schistocerca americana TaxID=7009 RepID=UPI001F502096|nr:eukaryotic translation initiation factor 3 subunit M [Schistocerca americana]XP_047120747.1 eukaryotic translation initiation factor 3 subunit M [Schistocerca piceifrons]XP_049766478.1 eukaryotic translation initiation factor 3 subunit M [Schistocerca cancellata]XP_049792111.1 eukaryotic translation initiation factor 3 subunit M [Schistocerca nitens]XP_049937425.1 eukaryotic translation initiation factor 3 subunit M [Schistocerca serialis cubense]
MLDVPVFTDLSLDDQAQELRVYFKSLGAEISEEKSPKGIEDDLHKIIGVCDACFKEGNESEIETILNGIVSMLVLIPVERVDNLILAFCEKLTKAPGHKLGMVSLRVGWLMFQSLDACSPMRYHVYYHLVQVAKQVDQVHAIFRDMDQLRQQFERCPPSNEQMQKLLRLLHEVLLECKQSEQAAKVMVELLGTYTAENASQARDDAQRCILAALADPNTFLLDPLLALKPVRFLEGQLIHDLLSIFVSEKLPSYLHFYQNHREFVHNLGLNHEQNMKKMRLLTFMQLAEGQSEMTFDTIQQELQLGENEVESFIIDVLKTKLVRARMDQAARKVFISSTMHRTFGRAQWQQLRDLLYSWKSNLQVMQEGMKSIASAQMEMMVRQQ